MAVMEPEADGSTVAAGMPVVRVTERARALVAEVRAAEEDGEHLALWLEVNGAQGDAYTYDVYFQAAADAASGDVLAEAGELAVVVPQASVAALRGATLDVSGEGEEAGLVVVNPNRPPSPGLRLGMPDDVDSDLESDLARRVLAVLEESVNPNIAGHGGSAELVAVGADTAYLRLAGGCQGCGMARVTLSQGIEVAIRDAVPEIVTVVDVTDHASGSNPYFSPAKK